MQKTYNFSPPYPKPTSTEKKVASYFLYFKLYYLTKKQPKKNRKFEKHEKFSTQY